MSHASYYYPAGSMMAARKYRQRRLLTPLGVFAVLCFLSMCTGAAIAFAT